MRDQYLVEMKGISKKFGNIQALKDVNLELEPGEVLGLIGDNAAGKSTLMKILFGALIPDEGKICINGMPVEFKNPAHAQSLGISMVYQDLALFPNLDVAANVFTGREYTNRLLGIEFLNKRRMYRETDELVQRLQISISSSKLLVNRMSGGQRQMVAVARAIGFDAKILIMDEPSAALGVQEAGRLLKLITHLRGQGLGIILITHRLTDVLAVGDRVMVLKGGQRQGVLDVKTSTLDDLETMIIKGGPTMEKMTWNNSHSSDKMLRGLS
ncbi:MAG: sugar ABC transporter ATP-binding protein [Anaerolineales bacterium]|nr:sugar ABC transporter ATP-binding protein [Anaerolineales bacterium]